MKTGEFQIQLVLKRLLEKGRIVYKRAYCDWSHYRDAVREFHAQGIELIDIPQSKMSGKNSADIRMVVDAWTCATRRTTSTSSPSFPGTATSHLWFPSSRKTITA